LQTKRPNKTKKKNSSAPGECPYKKVGNIKEYYQVLNKKTGRFSRKPIYFTYKDIEYDIDGWADCKRFLPEDFDLVLMRLKREKTINGWISGLAWNGLRLKPDDEVLFWKRRLELSVEGV
jgi:hypothetical protein